MSFLLQDENDILVFQYKLNCSQNLVGVCSKLPTRRRHGQREDTQLRVCISIRAVPLTGCVVYV